MVVIKIKMMMTEFISQNHADNSNVNVDVYTDNGNDHDDDNDYDDDHHDHDHDHDQDGDDNAVNNDYTCREKHNSSTFFILGNRGNLKKKFIGIWYF